MCDCQSYNRPEITGSTPEVELPYGVYFPASLRHTVCVDACIVEEMRRLWAAGVETGGCCCGHNGALAPHPSVIILDPAKAALAERVLSHDDRCWQVSAFTNKRAVDGLLG